MTFSLVEDPTRVQPIRVVVADRSRMYSQLLAESLGRHSNFEMVAVGAADLFSMDTQPNVALISMELGGSEKGGLTVARRLNAVHPDIHIVLLVEESTRESVISCFRCGATGVFSRSDPMSELHTSIERVNRGEIWVGGGRVHFLLEALRNLPSCEGIEDSRLELLSRRELEVAEYVAQGQSNKQIADGMGISEHTVKNYLLRVFEKLGVSSRFELLVLLFNDRNNSSFGNTREQGSAGPSQAIEAYLKAAEEGLVESQFIVGMAHLEGYDVEKNSHAAYYWLRMTEENTSRLCKRTHALLEELKATMKSDEVEALERNVADGIRHSTAVTGGTAELMKHRPASKCLQVVGCGPF